MQLSRSYLLCYVLFLNILLILALAIDLPIVITPGLIRGNFAMTCRIWDSLESLTFSGNEVTLVVKCFRGDKILRTSEHHRLLHSQGFQRAANSARQRKELANSQCHSKISCSNIPSAFFLPVLSNPGALQPLASQRMGTGWQKGSLFSVETSVINWSGFPTLCPSEFILREQVCECITSRKMLWKTSLSFGVGLHWGAIRCTLYWSLFHNLPWWLVLQSCSFCILQLLLQQRIVVWLASSTFSHGFSLLLGLMSLWKDWA